MRRVLICYLLWIGLGFAGENARLLALQSSDGLWRRDGRVDWLATGLAIGLLNDDRPDQALLARTVLLSQVNPPQALPATLMQTCAEEPPIWEHLSCYRCADGGWCFLPNGFPDVLSTAWALRMMTRHPTTVPAGWQEAASSWLHSQSQEGGFRLAGNETDRFLTLFVQVALAETIGHRSAEDDETAMALDDYPVADLLDLAELERSATSIRALALRLLCLQGHWDKVRILRESLLQSANADGCWAEMEGEPSDALTTCLVLEALHSFVLTEKPSADLQLPATGVFLEQSDNLLTVDALVFNEGEEASAGCRITLTALVSGEWLALASDTLPRLPSGRSTRVTCTATLPDSATALLLQVDQDGLNADSDRSNNSLMFPLPPQIQPFCSIGPILVDGTGTDGPLFLGPGMGVTLSSTLTLCGISSEVTLVWTDNGEELARHPLKDATDGCKETRMTWFPEQGTHQIILRLESAAGAQTACRDIRVSYEPAVVRTWRHDEAGAGLSSLFGPRETVEIEALTTLADCEASVVILKEQIWVGTAVGVPGFPTRFQWNTGIQEAGTCTAVATFRRNGAFCATATCDFQIQAQTKIDSLTLECPTHPEAFVREQWRTPLQVSWRAITNQETRLELGWRLQNDNGMELASAQMPVSCDWTSVHQERAFDVPLEYCFTAAGSYFLKAFLSGNGELLTEAETPILVKELPMVSLVNDVTPATLDKTAALVTTRIRLASAGGIGSGLPASFRAAPITVKDIRGAVGKLLLTDIRDSIGRTIPYGTLLCLIPYGTLQGESDLASGRNSGAVARLRITDGQAECLWYPAGGILDNGETVTLTARIHRDVNGVPGTRLGVVEIYLEGTQNEE